MEGGEEVKLKQGSY